MSDNGSIYSPPPHKKDQLAQTPEIPPMQTRAQAAAEEVIIPETQNTNTNKVKTNRIKLNKNKNNKNNNNKKKQNDNTGSNVPVIPSNPRARKRLEKRKIKPGKRAMSSDITDDSDNKGKPPGHIITGTSSEEDDSDISINTKNKINNKSSSDDTSRSGSPLITSFSAQLAELRDKYPDFTIKRQFERYIYDKYTRNDIIEAQARYKKTRKAFTLKQFDEYMATREAMADLLSTEQQNYFNELNYNKQLNIYIKLIDKMESAKAKLLKYTKEINPQHKKRKKLIDDYDKARTAVVEKAKEKPGNSKIPIARRWDRKSPDELRRSLRSGYTIWMDEKDNNKRSRSRNRNRNNNNNNNIDSNSESEYSDGNILPKSKSKKKTKSAPPPKKNSMEALNDIRERFEKGKNLTSNQRKFLLEKLNNISENANGFEEITGHKRAREEKEHIEDTNSESEGLPKKKRKLNNGEDRIDEAERKTREEVNYIYLCLSTVWNQSDYDAILRRE